MYKLMSASTNKHEDSYIPTPSRSRLHQQPRVTGQHFLGHRTVWWPRVTRSDGPCSLGLLDLLVIGRGHWTIR